MKLNAVLSFLLVALVIMGGFASLASLEVGDTAASAEGSDDDSADAEQTEGETRAELSDEDCRTLLSQSAGWTAASNLVGTVWYREVDHREDAPSPGEDRTTSGRQSGTDPNGGGEDDEQEDAAGQEDEEDDSEEEETDEWDGNIDDLELPDGVSIHRTASGAYVIRIETEDGVREEVVTQDELRRIIAHYRAMMEEEEDDEEGHDYDLLDIELPEGWEISRLDDGRYVIRVETEDGVYEQVFTEDEMWEIVDQYNLMGDDDEEEERDYHERDYYENDYYEQEEEEIPELHIEMLDDGTIMVVHELDGEIWVELIHFNDNGGATIVHVDAWGSEVDRPDRGADRQGERDRPNWGGEAAPRFADMGAEQRSAQLEQCRERLGDDRPTPSPSALGISINADGTVATSDRVDRADHEPERDRAQDREQD